MEYPHCEIHKGIYIYYYLMPDLVPTGLRIEPIYEYKGSCGRDIDGRMHKTEERLTAINVYGVYDV